MTGHLNKNNKGQEHHQGQPDHQGNPHWDSSKKIQRYMKEIKKINDKIIEEKKKLLAEEHGIKYRHMTPDQQKHIDSMLKHMEKGASFKDAHDAATADGFPFNQHKSGHKSGHKSQHKSGHKSQHKSGHKSQHKSGHKSQSKNKPRSKY